MSADKSSKRRIVFSEPKETKISDIKNIKTISDVINFTKGMIKIKFLNKVKLVNDKWLVLSEIDGKWIESESKDYIKIMCDDVKDMVICEILKSRIPRTKHSYDVFNLLNMSFFVNTVRDECEHLFYEF